MENNFYQQERRLEQGAVNESLGRYTAKTFLLMFVGLIVTFVTGYFLSQTRPGIVAVIYMFHYVPVLHLILLVAEVAVVVGMTSCLHKVSVGTARLFFFLYSVLTGVTFSLLFMVYEMRSLVFIFGATSLYFGGMAVFGFVTNIDLSRMRSILLGGLIFLLVANVVMWFLPGVGVMEQVVCSIGVVVFLALTAYDTQRMKNFYYAYEGDPEMQKKVSIYSALELYLDFLNMFLYLLRLLGKSKKR